MMLELFQVWKHVAVFQTNFLFSNFILYTYERTVVKVKVAQSCLTLCDPMDCSLPDSSFYGILQARILEQVVFPFSRGSSQPRSPALQVDSLPAEPPGKTKNTGVGILSLLQGIFSMQELNQGLLHCRWILYQLLPGKPIRLLCPQDSPTTNTGMGCHNLLLGNLPDPGIEPTSLMSPAQAGRFFTTSATWEAGSFVLARDNFNHCCNLCGTKTQ